jgi:SAM-dependent methyltransferase
MTAPWYDRAFGPWYAKLYPHRDEAEAARTLDTLAPWLGGARPVLDLACGTGRHLSELRHRVIPAFGLDRSRDLLAAAVRRPELGGRLVRGDMRRLPHPRDAFGGVLLLFTSFGYFPGRREHTDLLVEIARVTRPGGILVLDYMNAPALRRTLVPRSERRLDGHRVFETRRIEDGEEGPRVIKETVILDVEGRPRDRYEETVALYEPHEVAGMLTEAGWSERRRLGDYAAAPWSPETPRCLFVAERQTA